MSRTRVSITACCYFLMKMLKEAKIHRNHEGIRMHASMLTNLVHLPLTAWSIVRWFHKWLYVHEHMCRYCCLFASHFSTADSLRPFWCMCLPVCVFLQDKSQIPQEMPDMPNSQKMGELKAKVRLPHLNPSWALRVMCHWIGALGAKPEIVSVRVVSLCGNIWAIREFPFSFFFRSLFFEPIGMV